MSLFRFISAIARRECRRGSWKYDGYASNEARSSSVLHYRAREARARVSGADGRVLRHVFYTDGTRFLRAGCYLSKADFFLVFRKGSRVRRVVLQSDIVSITDVDFALNSVFSIKYLHLEM